MAHATATFPDVTLRYGSAFAHGGSRRTKSGRRAVGLGAVAASGAFGLVTVTAVCLVTIVISGDGATHAKLSPNLAMPVALLDPHPSSAGAEAFSGSALIAGPAYVRSFVGAVAQRTQVAALTPAAAPAQTPVAAPTLALTGPLPLPPRRPYLVANNAPLPRARPPSSPQAQEFTTASIDKAPEKAPTPVAVKPPAAAQQRVASLEPSKPPAPPEPDRRTAIYDIAAHTVYLPNGQKLEAHSGLGHRIDDPRYVSQRNRGPTPPNVYDLSLRERLFHGVRAIRLNPHDEDKMYGRDGMLAHTYMLGRSGQSLGCVSFKDYQAFLQAYLRGEIDRLVVVAHRDDMRTPVAHERRGRGERVASND